MTFGALNLFDRGCREHLAYQRDPLRSGSTAPEPGRNVFINQGVRS